MGYAIGHTRNRKGSMKATLADLLAQDGIQVKKGMALCPFHNDKNPSLSVNLKEGLYHCFSCHAQGDAVDYLVEKRGMSKKEAVEMAGKSDKPMPEKSEQKKREWVSELPRERVATHEYRLADGRLVFVVCRFESGAKCRPFSPSTRNNQDGWVKGCLLSNNRPVYLQETLPDDLEAQVWVVEGEKCADRVRETYQGNVAVVAWSFGTNSWSKTDWRILHKRTVLLVSDADEAGHKAMRELGTELHENGCRVRIALTETLDPNIKGYDVDDAIEQVGAADAVKWIQGHVEDFDPEKHGAKKKPRAKSQKEEEPVVINESIFNKQKFTILGMLNADRLTICTEFSDIIHRSREQIQQGSTLVSIAPRDWWLQVAQQPAITATVAQALGDRILRRAEEIGHIDLDLLAGRGALLDRNRVVWHLGDHLLVDGKRMPLADIPDPKFMYMRGKKINVPEVEVKPSHKADFINAMPEYRWHSDQDCAVFIGWLVTSMIGGILPWKPNMWICSGSGHGKSYLKSPVAENILGDFYTLSADATSAGLSRLLGSDSVPVILEESEPDEVWLKEILRTIRIASGTEGARIRADMKSGGVNIENPRFSVFMLSTKLPVMKIEDQNRFRFISLSPSPLSNTEWKRVKSMIESSITPEACASIRWQIVREAREIMEEAMKNQDEFQDKGMSTRDSMIDGCLKAGLEWFGGQFWKTQQQEHEIASMVMLRFILELRVSYTSENRRMETTIGQFIRSYHWDKIMQDEVVRQYGVYWKPGTGLIIAPQHGQLQKLLSTTQYSQVDITSVLKQHTGVKHTDNPVRFGGVRHRSLVIPRDMAEEAGLALEEQQQQSSADVI